MRILLSTLVFLLASCGTTESTLEQATETQVPIKVVETISEFNKTFGSKFLVAIQFKDRKKLANQLKVLNQIAEIDKANERLKVILLDVSKRELSAYAVSPEHPNLTKVYGKDGQKKPQTLSKQLNTNLVDKIKELVRVPKFSTTTSLEEIRLEMKDDSNAVFIIQHGVHWCGPCIRMKKDFVKYFKKTGDRSVVYRYVDVEKFGNGEKLVDGSTSNGYPDTHIWKAGKKYIKSSYSGTWSPEGLLKQIKKNSQNTRP